MAKEREAARKRFDEAHAQLREGVEVGFKNNGTSLLLSAAIPAFNAALADLMLTGLDEYLVAAAADRNSAAEDRKSAAANREADRAAAEGDKIKQERDRRIMNRLTGAIMAAAIASAFGTVYGAIHSPKAPVFDVPAAPAPIIQPVPVTLTPTFNVTAPVRPAK